MTRRERMRREVFSRVRDGEVTLTQASELLAVSYRQVKRLWSRYHHEGDAGLVHRLRGMASNRQVDAQLKAQALERYQTKYASAPQAKLKPKPKPR